MPRCEYMDIVGRGRWRSLPRIGVGGEKSLPRSWMRAVLEGCAAALEGGLELKRDLWPLKPRQPADPADDGRKSGRDQWAADQWAADAQLDERGRCKSSMEERPWAVGGGGGVVVW